MADQEPQLRIQIFCEDDGDIDNIVWALRANAAPIVGDAITVEQADETAVTYIVTGRRWLTAKQGTDTFGELHLMVKEDTETSRWIGLRSKNRKGPPL
ncbi:hypothetical protein AAG598_03145 [Citromicrobium bathyomarinum]